jgi:hypothetical protein
LADEQVAPAFLERIQQMAEDLAMDEFPGFLEIIATHVLQQGEAKNILRTAMDRHTTPVDSYAGAFLTAQLEGTTNYKGKETSGFMSAIRLAGLVLGQEGITDRILTERMAHYPDKWPTEMRSGLQAYARDAAQLRWLDLHSTLKPYMREGRLPLIKGAQVLGKQAGKKGTTTLSVSSKSQNHESVVAETGIESFALIGRAVARGVFEIAPVADLDELYAASNLPDYVRAHAEDKSLEPLFRSALKYLIQPPYNPTRVRKLREVAYKFDTDASDKRRKPYRLKLQGTSDIAKGPIADSTRVIFDIIRSKEGQPTLAIYGAFIKQAIAEMNELPTRR